MKLGKTRCRIGRINKLTKPTAVDSVNEIATVRIELRYTKPLIWREVDVN